MWRTLGSAGDLLVLVKQIAAEQNADAVILAYDTWILDFDPVKYRQYGEDRMTHMVAAYGSLAAAEAAGLGKRVEAISLMLQTADRSRGLTQRYARNGDHVAVLQREEVSVEGGRMLIPWLSGSGRTNPLFGAGPPQHRARM